MLEFVILNLRVIIPSIILIGFLSIIIKSKIFLINAAKVKKNGASAKGDITQLLYTDEAVSITYSFNDYRGQAFTNTNYSEKIKKFKVGDSIDIIYEITDPKNSMIEKTLDKRISDYTVMIRFFCFLGIAIPLAIYLVYPLYK